MSAHLTVGSGTSNTVALLRWREGRVQPIPFDSSPLPSSAVYAEVDGRLLTGRDATRAARLDPARFEPNPKRRVDDTEVLFGDAAVTVVDLIAATLRRVNDEAVRALGQRPQTVVLGLPATPTLIAAAIGAWLDERRGVATRPAWQFTVVILAGATISPLLLAAAPITLVIVVWQLRKRRRA
ncbi:hypothetical protein OHA72_52500 [Dactylosporangium sp. NBC_01737]|uniref:hypothetical protein n=1 Tax=Dactylosporangium sp. NBC_01737 TaxID=2975959 RepID=UPI002E0DF768|nr:hypothetical protein OHA72_52500 [Dactylosporangium sp. NBC_01737]